MNNMICVPLFPPPVIDPYGNNLFNTFSVFEQQPPQPQQPIELSLPRYVNYLADYSGCGF
jgi:hypothetical protein